MSNKKVMKMNEKELLNEIVRFKKTKAFQVAIQERKNRLRNKFYKLRKLEKMGERILKERLKNV